jgi:hypothetical protein
MIGNGGGLLVEDEGFQSAHDTRTMSIASFDLIQSRIAVDR